MRGNSILSHVTDGDDSDDDDDCKEMTETKKPDIRKMRRTNLDLLDGSDALRRCLDSGNLSLSSRLAGLWLGDALQHSSGLPFGETLLRLGFGFGDPASLRVRLGFGAKFRFRIGNAEFRPPCTWLGSAVLGKHVLDLLCLARYRAHLALWRGFRFDSRHLGLRLRFGRNQLFGLERAHLAL